MYGAYGILDTTSKPYKKHNKVSNEVFGSQNTFSKSDKIWFSLE